MLAYSLCMNQMSACKALLLHLATASYKATKYTSSLNQS